jgi:hypothetical protein
MGAITKAVLDQIDSLGYAVSVFHINGSVEMHAVKLATPNDQHIARHYDGDGEQERT